MSRGGELPGAFALDSSRWRELDGQRAVVELPHGWTAPAMFGGMAAACVLRAGTQLTARGSEATHPLSVAASFHRPLQPGPAEIAIEELARTRRTRSVLARVAGGLTVTATLSGLSELGAARPAPASGPAPVVPGPECLRPLPGLGGAPREAAAMSRQVDWRALTPWESRGEGGPVLGWLRPRRAPWTAGGYLDPLWYVVAADLLGPCFYAGSPFRIATLSLDVQVHGLTRSPWLLVRATPQGRAPWVGGRIELWNRAGALVATGSQRAKLTTTGAELPWSVTAFGSGVWRPFPKPSGNASKRLAWTV